MNKTDLIAKVKSLPYHCVVVGGGAVVMYGLRDETSDLDIQVRLEDFYEIPGERRGDLWKTDGDLDIQVTDYPSVEIEGISVMTLESLLEMKMRMNRPKDQEDIRKIKALMA